MQKKTNPIKKVYTQKPLNYLSQQPQNTYLNADMRNVNYLFYTNKMEAIPTIYKISDMLKWKGQYGILEKNHSYIQWIFPNRQKSKFNHSSRILSDVECELFRKDKQIALNMVACYEMMLDFYGIQLVDRRKGTLKRSINYENRYISTLVNSPHNHLRISRILGSLNACGFRIYAVNLVEFLRQEIYEIDSPLNILQKLYSPMVFWSKYGIIDQNDFKGVANFEKQMGLKLSYCENYQSVYFQDLQEKEQFFQKSYQQEKIFGDKSYNNKNNNNN